MRETIFILEDDRDISRLVKDNLAKAGFAAVEFATPKDILQEAEKLRPSLFLLDIMVPQGDGLSVCKRIREHPQLAKIPVIFLTAKTSELDRVTGLEIGADDYIAKPFSPRELIARVKAVLRRFERPLGPSVIQLGRLRIDSEAMKVFVEDEQVPMTATEFRLLDFLARHPGRVFTRDQILDSVWRDTQFVTPRSVDVYVRKLREKIEKDAENPTFVHTVRGAGYRFEAPR